MYSVKKTDTDTAEELLDCLYNLCSVWLIAR